MLFEQKQYLWPLAYWERERQTSLSIYTFWGLASESNCKLSRSNLVYDSTSLLARNLNRQVNLRDQVWHFFNTLIYNFLTLSFTEVQNNYQPIINVSTLLMQKRLHPFVVLWKHDAPAVGFRYNVWGNEYV